MQYVMRLMYVWLMVGHPMTEELRSVCWDGGVLCVMTNGTTERLQCYVDNWDIMDVRIS